MYVCTYVFMYVCICVSIYLFIYVSVYECMYVSYCIVYMSVFYGIEMHDFFVRLAPEDLCISHANPKYLFIDKQRW